MVWKISGEWMWMVKRDSEKKTYIVGEGEHDDIWLSHIQNCQCLKRPGKL